MGTYLFKLPDIGEGIAEAEIVAWHIDVGEVVKEDQPIVDVMTEKATVEIGSPVAGRIVRRKGEVGDTAVVGDELIAIATDDLAKTDSPKVAGTTLSVTGTTLPEVEPSAAVQPRTARPAEHPARKSLAAPAVRARADALGIDLADVEGSGTEGRVLHEDLDAVLLRRHGGPVPRPAGEAREGVEEVRVIGLRRQIAQAMQDAKRRIPHFAYVEEINVTALETLRRDLNDSRSSARVKLTLLPFLIAGLVKAVPDHPGVNAHFDDEAGVIRRYAALHIGIATQTRRGLVVPVIRHAETFDLWGIAAEIGRLSEAARAGKATRDELSGSTITVSSLGPLGGIAATPIVKPPEVAIVGVNKIVERPVVREGQIVIRKIMNLSSSFDHRVVDGSDAASFIQSLRLHLEAPARLLVAF